MQFRRMGVFGDSNEQFGTHEKLPPTSTIYVNCMKHDPDIDIEFYVIQGTSYSHLHCINLVYDFIYHTPSFEYVPIYNFRLIFAGNLSVYRQDCDSAYSASIQHDTGNNQTL